MKTNKARLCIFGIGITDVKSEKEFKGVLGYDNPVVKKFRNKRSLPFPLPPCYVLTKSKKEWLRLVTESAASCWDYANGPDGV